MKPTAAQRRRLQTLAPLVASCSQGDRAFFQRFPNRQYRVRLSSAAEVEQAAIHTGRDMVAPPGCRYFTVVKNVCEGARLWVFVLNCDDAVETDLPEQAARALWEATSSPRTEQLEQHIRKHAGAQP